MASRITYYLERTAQAAGNLFTKGSWSRKARMLRYMFPDEVRLASKTLFLSKLELQIPMNSLEFVLDSYAHLRNLKDRAEAKVFLQHDVVVLQIGGIKLEITTAEEAFIASEIFLSGTYDFSACGQFVLVDIGMNVGLASLFFAAKPEVSRVYAFEPFEKTFQQALRNFDLNPHLSHKILPFDYGLSDVRQTLVVDFDYDNKGQVGIYGTGFIAGKLGSVNKAEIVLKGAAAEVNRILSDHPDEDAVLKIDCEGSEYAIISNLFDHDLLRLFRIVVIEWHEKGAKPLVEMLRRSDFSVFCQQSPTKKVGMVYAIR